MKKRSNTLIKHLRLIFFTTLTLQIVGSELNQDPQIIQPGAPGNPSKIIDAKEATDIANTLHI